MRGKLLLTALILITMNAVVMAETKADSTAAAMSEPLIITGSKVKVSRANVPLTVSVISREEIEQSGESAILPVLSRRIPGVFVTERGVTGFGVGGSAAGQISIRGVGGSPNTQNLILIDGHPQFMGIFGHPLPDAYVSSDLEQVEVIRGPASILYGTGAMGGVINFITKKQTIDGLRFNGQMSYGSHHTHKYNGSIGYRHHRFNLLASLNRDETDGHRDNSDFEVTNGYVKAGVDLNRFFTLTVDGNLTDFYTQDPGPASAPYIATGDEHWVDIQRGKVALSLDNEMADFSGAAKFFYNFGEHDIYDGFHSTDYNMGLLFYQTLNKYAGNTMTLGIDVKNYGGKAENIFAMNGQGLVLADTSATETGVYGLVQQMIRSKLMLTAGLRVETHREYDPEIVPQLGCAFHPRPGTTVKGSVAKGFRSPTIRELYMWNSQNADLEPERMWNYELSFMQEITPHLRIELTGFIAEGDNLIKMIIDETGPLNVNTGEFANQGLELTLDYQVTREIKLSANYSFLNMDEPIVSTPEQQIFGEVIYHRPLFTICANGQHIASLYTVVTPDMEKTENYTLINASLTLRPTDSVEFFVQGENLLDTDYVINADYPMPGVTVFGGFKLNYQLF